MSSPAPAIVYGALRSGTTVFRLMLNAHPALKNSGEADFLFDYARCDQPGPGAEESWRYDLDRMRMDRVFQHTRLQIDDEAKSANFDGRVILKQLLSEWDARSPGAMTINVHRHADRMVSLLPDARIIHLLRDPRDVARSCVGRGWAGTTYYGIDPWIDTERAWDRIAHKLTPEQVLELRYEDLMVNPEGELTRACRFLGVPFDPLMLDYHLNTTYAPPDPALIEQWRQKLDQLELGQIEAKLGDMLRKRGYKTSGVPLRSPSLLGRAVLAARDKIGVWRFAAKRHGTSLIIAEKLTRRLGLRKLHRRAKQRINDRTATLVK